MAKKLSGYEGGVLVSGGIEPAGDFYVAEAGYILAENGKDLATKLGEIDAVIGGNGGESLPSQIGNLNDKFANYYTKTQIDAASGTGAKVDKSAIQTALSNSSTDTQVPSAKATYTAIEAAKNAASTNKTDAVTSGSGVPVTSGGVYSKLQDYYTKAEAGEMFYVAIVVNTATLSKTTFEQGDTAKTANFNWSTNTLAVSAKVTVGSGTATETITGGVKKNNGTYSVTIDTDTVGNNSASKTVAVKVDVKDAFDGTASKSVNATVCNNIILGGAVRYTGSNLAAVMGDANMSVKKLQGSRTLAATNVTVNSGKMLTIAIPTGYGNASFKVAGQDTILNKKGSAVKYNNQFNKEVTYDLYQLNPNGNDLDLVAANTTYSVQIL